MVSFVNHHSYSSPFVPAIDEFWETYTKGKYTSYPTYDVTGLRAYIKSLNDDEMLEYVRNLNEYLDICNEYFIDSWDYPDKEELEVRDSLILSLQQRSKSYKGSRLRGQYHLLYMRCLMLLKQWNEIVAYWQSTGKRQSPSVYRSMMENIYAGALFHKGETDSALEIFSRQGDAASIQWSMRKHINLAGLHEIYGRNPNSPILPYILQQYMNDVQEMFDCKGNAVLMADDEEDEEGKSSPEQVAAAFCQFADSVLANPDVAEPCMWGTSQAMAYYLLGDQEKARAAASHALSLAGNDRVKDNCRCVNMLIESSDTTCNLDWLLGELQWLEGKCHGESLSDYCYTNAYDRIVVKSLSTMLRKQGKTDLALAVLGMFNEWKVQQSPSHYRSPVYDYEMRGESTWNEDYQNEFINLHVYPLSASACESFYHFVTTPQPDRFSQWVCSRVYKDKNFFNDLIGTKYMAEAKFAQAIPFLEKVDLKYLSQLNVSHYMHSRDYHIERWLTRQGKKEDWSNEGTRHIQFSSNPKLSYCHEILDLQKAYSKNSMGEKGNQIAYQLATLYYQASYKGDCWWLISYKNSSNPYVIEHDHAGENDFVKSSEVYLRSCLDTKDDKLLGKCLYAMAYTATDDWLKKEEADEDEDLEDEGFKAVPDPLSEKYACLDKLNLYYEQHKANAPAYMSKCDVLKQFRKMKWLMDY